MVNRQHFQGLRFRGLSFFGAVVCGPRENVQLQPRDIILSLLLMFYITSTLHILRSVILPIRYRSTAIRLSLVTVIPVMQSILSSWI